MNALLRLEFAAALIIWTLPVLSQQVNPDSLFRVWKDDAQPDTIRLSALHDICTKVFFPGKLDSAFHYAQLQFEYATSVADLKYQAAALNTLGTLYRVRQDPERSIDHYSRSLKIRERLGDKKGMAASLNNLGSVHEDRDKALAIAYCERSLAISESLNDKQGMAISLNRMGSAYHYSDPQRAMLLYTRSLTLGEEVGDQRLILNCLNKIGVLYQARGEYSEAIEYVTRSLAMCEKMGDRQGIITALNNIATNYYKQGAYSHAIETYNRSLAVAEQAHDELNVAVVLGNIGVIHEAQGDTGKALEYHTRSLKVKEALGDTRGIAITLQNIGDLFYPADLPNALNYFQRSLKIKQEFGDVRGIASSENNIGDVYRLMRDPKRALKYYQSALAGFERAQDKEGISVSMSNIGLIHQAGGTMSEAIRVGTEALDLARSIESAHATRDAAKALYESYRAAGMYRLSVAAFRQYSAIRDSLLNEQTQRAIVKEELRYELGKRAAQDSLNQATEANSRKNENAIVHLTATKQHNATLLVANIILLLMMGGGIIFTLDRKRRKTRYARKAALLQTQVWRTQVNPQFIHTALNNINAYVQANERDLASSYLTRFARLMRSVLENARKDEVSLSSDIEVLREYLELEKLRMNNAFTYTVGVDGTKDPAEVMVPPMLLQPFVEDAIWQRMNDTGRPWLLDIRVHQRDGALIMSVEDDRTVAVTPQVTTDTTDALDHTAITRTRLELLAQQTNKPVSVRTVPLLPGQRIELQIPISLAA